MRLAGFHDGRNGYRFAYHKGARTPFAMRRDDGAEAFLFYDQVGSLRIVADRSGNVIKEVRYDPFGEILEDTNPDLRIPLGFAGGLHDRDLGFVRFGFRDYDTKTGRWTAPDPIGDAGGDPDSPPHSHTHGRTRQTPLSFPFVIFRSKTALQPNNHILQALTLQAANGIFATAHSPWRLEPKSFGDSQEPFSKGS